MVTYYVEGATKLGGACQVLPLQKGGGGGKRFSHAEGAGGGGHTKFWGSHYTVACSFSCFFSD